MASLKDIRRRIASVKSTRQTTRAMKMVAAAKLRKSQDAIVNARPYADKIDEVVGKAVATNAVESPFFIKNTESKKELIIVLTSDRGLCGGFNASISRKALDYLQANKAEKEFEIVCVGRKGAEYLKLRGFPSNKVVLNLVKDNDFKYASKFTEEIVAKYFDEKFAKVICFYNKFESALSQVPQQQTILPIEPKEELWEKYSQEFSKDYIFEPQAAELVGELLEKTIAMQIFKCFLESLASEHGARMNSMENATKNAGELISKLTLTYNNLRQAAITSELIEITSGAEAL